MAELKVTHVPSKQTEVMDIPAQSYSLQNMHILTVRNVSEDQIGQLRILADEMRNNKEHVMIIPLSEDMRVEQLKFETRAANGGYLCPQCGHEMIRESTDDLVRTFEKYHCDDCSIGLTKEWPEKICLKDTGSES